MKKYTEAKMPNAPKSKPMSYNKGGMVKANCGASMKPMQKKSGK